MDAFERTLTGAGAAGPGRATLRRDLAAHPAWSRALGDDRLASRMILPLVVSASVEDRERIEGTGQLERLSITELVRDARAAASAGFAGLLLYGSTDRKDARAFIASERDHIVVRAIRAVKEAVPELGIATDVCVCAYTEHGQCVLFRDGGADVAGTLQRLGEIAVAHADAGADLVIPSGMLDGSVAAVRAALADRHESVPVAALAKLESTLYSMHPILVDATRVRERAVPLLAADQQSASRNRALRDVAEGADAVVVTPGAPALDIVASLRELVGRPVISYHTVDEHAAFVIAADQLDDAPGSERETLAASRRAGADLIISYGAWNAAD